MIYTKIPVTTEALFLKMKKQTKHTDKLSRFHSLSCAKQSANYLKQKEVETFELSGLTARDQWALFINSGQQEVYEKLVEENKTFEKAYERLKKASSDETLMAMYRNREKSNTRLE